MECPYGGCEFKFIFRCTSCSCNENFMNRGAYECGKCMRVVCASCMTCDHSPARMTQMTQAAHVSFLDAFHPDIEHRYHEYLRIAEVCILSAVSRTLHRRIRKSLRAYSWHAVHCEDADPAPLVWLTHIAKLGVNLRSVRLKNPCRQFALACRDGLSDAARILVKELSIDINKLMITHEVYAYKLTLLQFAAKSGHLEIVKLLVSVPNIDVNAVCVNGRTALHIATISGHLEIVEFLVTMPSVDVNAVDAYGKTALHIAAAGYSDLNMVIILVTVPRKILAHAFDFAAKRVLRTAATSGRLDVIEVFMKIWSVHRNSLAYTNTLLHFAALNALLDVVKFLVTVPNVDVNAVFREGASSALRYTLGGPCDGYTALHCASAKGYLEVVSFLVTVPNVDVNAVAANGKTALQVAVKRGHFGVVKLLEPTQADVALCALMRVSKRLFSRRY